MKKQTNICKTASISLVFLMAVFHSTSAMEDGIDNREKGKDPVSLSIPHDIPETRKAIASLTHHIRAKVEKILENFRNNMDAYYARTRNPKRITVTTASDKKISENLASVPEETTITNTTAESIGSIETHFLNASPTIDIKRISKSPEEIAERTEEKLQETISGPNQSHEKAEKILNTEPALENKEFWENKSKRITTAPDNKTSEGPENRRGEEKMTPVAAIESAGSIEAVHHNMASANLPEPASLLQEKYEVRPCGFTGKPGKLVFTQNQSNLVTISDLELKGLLPEIDDEDAFIENLKKEYNYQEHLDRYAYANPYGDYQISRFVASLSPDTVLSLKLLSEDPLQYGQRIQWESGNNLRNMDIRLIIESAGKWELYIEYPYGFTCGSISVFATQKFIVRKQLFKFN